MKLAVAIIALSASAIAADIPLDPKKPTLLKPSSIYAFSIAPGKDAGTATIRLHTENTDQFKDAEGNIYSPIDKITVQHRGEEYEIEYDYVDAGVPDMNIADFDGDGFLDFRIIAAWGTGGSWYCYYRYKDGRFHRWAEPEDIGLNGMPENGRIASFARSGPEYSTAYYQFKDGRFQKQRVESVRLKDSLPELKDWKTDEFIFISVVEEWNDNRLIRRILEPQYEPK